MLERLNHMKMKNKLNFGYRVVIGLMIISAIFSMIGMGIIYGSLQNYANGAQRADTAVRNCRININIAARNIREMLLNEDESTYNNYKAVVEQRLLDVSVELQAIRDTGLVDQGLCQQYADALDKWGNIGYKIINEVEAGNKDKAFEEIMRECVPALEEVVNVSEKINQITDGLKEDFFLVGEMLHGDYNRLMNDSMLHSATNYECYKGLHSSFNSMNMFEIVHSLLRQFGPENWTLYKGKHLLSFVDNHDVSRVASILNNEKHLPLIYAMAFGMPGIPCVYYGSEWGAKALKSQGDPALRQSFEEPQWTELTEWISALSAAKKQSEALNYGAFRSVLLTNRQCIFERRAEHERVLVAINADENDFTAHFDAGCGRAVDLISGKEHDFGGGSVLPAYSAYYWKMER